jgi:hypothetical protein
VPIHGTLSVAGTCVNDPQIFDAYINIAFAAFPLNLPIKQKA